MSDCSACPCHVLCLALSCPTGPGRFWVILVFSIIYFVGMLGITLVNVIPAIAPSKTAQPPAGIDATRSIFWVSGHTASHSRRG